MKISRVILAVALVATGTSLQAQTDVGPQVITQNPNPTAAPVKAPLPAKPAPQYTYNSIYTTEPVIAITFDDGPAAKLTPQLLDLLKEHNIKATFFVLGQMVEQNPDILRRAAAEGHEIASHTWDHKALNRISAEAVASELSRTTQIITEVTGKKPTLMRPPYGATNPALNKRIYEEFGQKVILWSVDPFDWKNPGSAVITSRILSQTQPGGIILSHDIHAGTIKAMPDTLDQLKAKGYRFVTVSELLSMDKGPAPKPLATPKPAAQGVHSKGASAKGAASATPAESQAPVTPNP
ncbi:MAG: polysaccharide deacetylase family protein [Chthoniobacterales bacterium]